MSKSNSGQHTPGLAGQELQDFALKHSSVLASGITRLCGEVIAKGMQGILEEVCRLQMERDALLRVAELVVEWLDEEPGAHALCDTARAAIAKAEGKS